MIEKLAKR